MRYPHLYLFGLHQTWYKCFWKRVDKRWNSQAEIAETERHIQPVTAFTVINVALHSWGLITIVLWTRLCIHNLRTNWIFNAEDIRRVCSVYASVSVALIESKGLRLGYRHETRHCKFSASPETVVMNLKKFHLLNRWLCAEGCSIKYYCGSFVFLFSRRCSNKR